MKASDFDDPHDLGPYLQFMVRAEPSDLFLTVGAPSLALTPKSCLAAVSCRR